MVSQILKVAAATIATLSFASAASAGCGSSLYCGNSGGSSMTSLSSYSGSSYGSGSYGSASSYGSGSSYGSSYGSGSSYGMSGGTTLYTPSSSYTTTMSSAQADATYGTGSISETYSGGNTMSFSGSPSAITGLGMNESLQPVNCPVNVYGSGEGSVLGCYNVVKPVPQTSYYRVVRPVVYVRYPVPVAVPYTSPCHTFKVHSRYGDFGQRGFGRRCG